MRLFLPTERQTKVIESEKFLLWWLDKVVSPDTVSAIVMNNGDYNCLERPEVMAVACVSGQSVFGTVVGLRVAMIQAV
jgi:hypothetical protein